LGDATMITVKIGSGSDAAMVSVKAPKEYRTTIGEQVNVSIDPKLCHLFDASTGTRQDS